MRVLHLTGEHEDAGGVLSVLRNLQAIARSNESWRFNVWVRSDYQETRCPALNYVRSRHAGASDHRHLFLLYKSFLAYRDVRQVLRGGQFDVVHAHTRGTLLIGLWLTLFGGFSVVFTNHNFARKLWLYRSAVRVPRLHSVMLTPNMARHYQIAPEQENVSLISACYADKLLVRPLVAQRDRGGGDGKIRLVGIGNIVRWKNWHLVVEALARLPLPLRRRFEFDHWGPILDDQDSRTYWQELNDSVKRSGLEETFRFHGMTTEVYERLDGANWFILPSTNEPCSVALMEALACGLPAIVSRSGGSIDILKDRSTGIMFSPDDAADLARALKEIANGEICPISGEGIRESVRERCASVVFGQYADLYARWQITGRGGIREGTQEQRRTEELGRD